MFDPPYCPYHDCKENTDPTERFYIRRGSYAVKCRAHRVPRFLCKSCKRMFSRQTFRMDYRDHRPDLNPRLFGMLASGIGLRQAGRMLGLSHRCTELKARKIGRHLRRLNLNLRGPLPPGASFQLDELETYEGRRNTRPLSVPILIERESRFVVWAEAAPIRPRGKMTEKRLAAIAQEERIRGRRKDLSWRSVARTLRRGMDLARDMKEVRVETDEKKSYPSAIADAFLGKRITHETTNSKLARDTWNALFPINHTDAMLRDLLGRMRRESWLVSKARRWLDVALHVFITFRNYVRYRFNGEEKSPAQRLGFVPRRMTLTEVLSWRQTEGRRSLHPLTRRSESIDGFGRHERRRRRVEDGLISAVVPPPGAHGS